MTQCENTCPPTWTAHWREWHRGHGCNLDPQRESAAAINAGATPVEEPQPESAPPSSSSSSVSLSERETVQAIDKRATGLYRKFENITRTDGSSAPGGKHDGCDYFVLDLTHDPHAPAAILAYAQSCEESYPVLAADLRVKVGAASSARLQSVEPRIWPCGCRVGALAACETHAAMETDWRKDVQAASIESERETLIAERDEAERTVKSIAAMLGWMNVPPRDVLESDLRAVKARPQQLEAEIASLSSQLAACHSRLIAVKSQLDETQAHGNWLSSQLAGLRTALKPFARFAEKWEAKPLTGIADAFYGIHAGEDGAELRLSDCQRARAALAASQERDTTTE